MTENGALLANSYVTEINRANGSDTQIRGWLQFASRINSRKGQGIARVDHTITQLNDELIVIGGRTKDDQPIQDALLIKDGGYSYSKAGAMLHPRFGHSTSLIPEGKLQGNLLVTGGLMYGIKDRTLKSAPPEVYLVKEKRFVNLTSFFPRHTLSNDYTFASSQTLQDTGEVFLTGGTKEEFATLMNTNEAIFGMTSEKVFSESHWNQNTFALDQFMGFTRTVVMLGGFTSASRTATEYATFVQVYNKVSRNFVPVSNPGAAQKMARVFSTSHTLHKDQQKTNTYGAFMAGGIKGFVDVKDPTKSNTALLDSLVLIHSKGFDILDNALDEPKALLATTTLHEDDKTSVFLLAGGIHKKELFYSSKDLHVLIVHKETKPRACVKPLKGYNPLNKKIEAITLPHGLAHSQAYKIDDNIVFVGGIKNVTKVLNFPSTSDARNKWPLSPWNLAGANSDIFANELLILANPSFERSCDS